jgi:acyl carrier protein
MTLEERAIAAIARGVSRKSIEITPDTRFEMLDIDSVDRLQILFELEQEFDVVIPDRVASRAVSVSDVIARLKETLQ